MQVGADAKSTPTNNMTRQKPNLKLEADSEEPDGRESYDFEFEDDEPGGGYDFGAAGAVADLGKCLARNSPVIFLNCFRCIRCC